MVVVLDSGVDYNNEDIKEAMWDDGLNYPELTALGGGRYGYNAVDPKDDEEKYGSNDEHHRQTKKCIEVRWYFHLFQEQAKKSYARSVNIKHIKINVWHS